MKEMLPHIEPCIIDKQLLKHFFAHSSSKNYNEELYIAMSVLGFIPSKIAIKTSYFINKDFCLLLDEAYPWIKNQSFRLQFNTFEAILYVINNQLSISIDDGCIDILYGSNKNTAPIVQQLKLVIQKLNEKECTQSEGHFYAYFQGIFRPFKVNPYEIQLNEHYNDSLQEMHQYLVPEINEKNAKGLLLFFGMPGTGKTSYIRYLTRILNKKVIFIHQELAHALDESAFINLMLTQKDSVLVIEDAEFMLVSRDQNTSFSVSSLLNITDGLLSDCLNVKIICTFNTHIRNIDTALLRKGRLIAAYEFEKLNLRKTNALLKKLGSSHISREPLTLADIYHISDPDFQLVSNKKIGF